MELKQQPRKNQAYRYGEQTGGCQRQELQGVGKMGERGYYKVQLPAVK